jgi:hypothetical protein
MRVTDQIKDFLNRPNPARFPFDRFGLACLAWAGAFVALTAVLSLTLK